VKAATDLPLAVGFGISNRTHVEEVGNRADAAVVGSALIKVMLESPRGELVERTSQFVSELAGVSLPN
jgi:tryptophan synthase alpha subunit